MPSYYDNIPQDISENIKMESNEQNVIFMYDLAFSTVFLNMWKTDKH